MSLQFTKQGEDTIRPLAYCGGGKYDRNMIWLHSKRIKPSVSDIQSVIGELHGLDSKKDEQELMIAVSERRKPRRLNLQRFYEEAIESLDELLQRRIEFEDSTKLVPVSYVSPVDEKQNFRMYLSGPSGVGKSTQVANIITLHLAVCKAAQVFMFSKHKEDPSFAPIEKSIVRIPCDETLLELEKSYCAEDFQGFSGCHNIVIFDDCLNIPDKKVRMAVEAVMKDVLTTGRHSFLDVFCISHDLMGGMQTKPIIANCNMICVYPQNGKSQIEKFLKTYLALTSDQIHELCQTESRWVMISKSYPQFFLDEKRCILLQ